MPWPGIILLSECSLQGPATGCDLLHPLHVLSNALPKVAAAKVYALTLRGGCNRLAIDLLHLLQVLSSPAPDVAVAAVQKAVLQGATTGLQHLLTDVLLPPFVFCYCLQALSFRPKWRKQLTRR